MGNIKFTYLYRDGANTKSWGEIVFENPENLTLDQISEKLITCFLPDKQFIASQISVPDKFLFLNGEFSEYDHCYHEFDSVEICEEDSSDTLGRTITDFLQEVEINANNGWEALDVLKYA